MAEDQDRAGRSVPPRIAAARGLKWLLCLGLAFLVGRYAGSTVLINLDEDVRPGMAVRLAGAEFSAKGAHRLEVAGGPARLVQVCADGCDDIVMNYDDWGRGGAFLRVTDAQGACVDCGGFLPGERAEVRRGPGLEAQRSAEGEK